MNQTIVEALQYENNLPELKPYFDMKPFHDIVFDESTTLKTMLDSGYTSNIATKFWRVLKTEELIESYESNFQMSDYFLEVFANQCLACTDILAAWVNHFLNLGLSGTQLSIHNHKFIETFKNHLTDPNNDSQIDNFYKWAKTKLYPYRNIIHHMGELSSAVPLNVSFVAVPKESEWDFVQMRNDLRDYPSQTAFQIAAGTLNLPNIYTGDSGDSDKYENISDFAEGWKNQIYDMIKTFVKLVISERATIIERTNVHNLHKAFLITKLVFSESFNG